MMILLYRQIKKTEGWKRSISRQKIIEVSMIFAQVLLLTFFFTEVDNSTTFVKVNGVLSLVQDLEMLYDMVSKYPRLKF